MWGVVSHQTKGLESCVSNWTVLWLLELKWVSRTRRPLGPPGVYGDNDRSCGVKGPLRATKVCLESTHREDQVVWRTAKGGGGVCVWSLGPTAVHPSCVPQPFGGNSHLWTLSKLAPCKHYITMTTIFNRFKCLFAGFVSFSLINCRRWTRSSQGWSWNVLYLGGVPCFFYRFSRLPVNNTEFMSLPAKRFHFQKGVCRSFSAIRKVVALLTIQSVKNNRFLFIVW